MDRNDYISPETVPEVIHRTREWANLVEGGGEGVKAIPVETEARVDEAFKRIITHDAERTFVDPERRKTLVRITSNYCHRFGDYAQGLSLVCGFLLLSLRETEVAKIITVLATTKKYIPDYWRAQAIPAAKDAYVFEYFLQHHEPEIAGAFKKHGLFPEAYCPKWLVALSINVLPFSALYRFFESFLEQGHLYLFKFGITYTSTFKEHLLKAQTHQVFEILRFDKSFQKKYSVDSSIVLSIVESASTYQLLPVDIEEVRESLYKKFLEPRLERAKQAAAAQKEEDDDEDEDDDDDDDEDDDNEDDEEGAECGVCKKNMPGLWCTVCKTLMCEGCHESNKGKHKKTHKIDENWEKYEKK